MSDDLQAKKDVVIHPQPVEASREPVNLIGTKSPGVQRIEAISSQIRPLDRFFLFFGVFLVSYASGLDGSTRGTYQPLATASYAEHSLLATINVLCSVIGALAQPLSAKIADVFGRIEVIMISVLFYVLGTIVEASSTNVQAFCAGAVLYQIGYIAVLLLIEVLVADMTSLRTRLFFSYIPSVPFLINTWVGGNVTAAVLGGTTWRWGIGMWALIYPVCALSLLVPLYVVHRRVKKSGVLAAHKTPFQKYGGKRLLIELFWQLDAVGIFLMIVWLSLIFVPFTIAGGEVAQWKTAKIIVPLVIGFLTLPVWIWWEATCQHPMVPFKLLRDRAVWGALGIAFMVNTSWALQGDYLYTVLVVSFDESIMSATRIASLYAFASVITGLTLGLIVMKVRQLKPFIVAGTVLFTVAFGVLIRYRGGFGESSHSGIIGGEILLGIAGGMFPYPAQASIQAASKHEHLAVITGLYRATYSLGSALGNTLSGAIWTQVLPRELTSRLGNATLAAEVYGDPFDFAATNPVGTFARAAVIDAYKYTQRLLCITGICLTLPLIVFALCLRNPILTEEQSLEESESNARNDEESS